MTSTTSLQRLCPQAATHTLRCAVSALVLTCLATGAVQAEAPPPIKPGLWEVSNQGMQMNGQAMPDHSKQMMDAMKSMPPQMRKQIEAQMKAKGIDMSGASAGGGMTVRMCMTKDMLDQNRWQKPQDGCTSQLVSRTASAWKWKMSCTQPPAQGEGTTTFSSSEAYSTQIHMTTMRDGRPQTMDMTHQAKWLGSDCGSVKPVTMPAQK